MPKAISGYIVALILVVIVLVIVGYLLFTYYGNFSNAGKYTDCTAKKLRYCFDWEQNGYKSNPDGSWDSYAPGCTAAGLKVTTKSDCTGETSTTTTT